MEKIDVSKLPLVGEGGHGKVYRLDKNRCIKICNKTKDMQKEYKVLKLVEGYPQFPEVYECKGKYMIREYVDGIKIKDYIARNGLNYDLARQLTELIIIFMELDFKRIDIRMQEVFVTKNHKIKIVDTTRYLDKKSSYPFKMLRTLEHYGYKEKYMNFLKENYIDLYNEWSKKINK